jgi:hypothetical protein
MPENINRSIAGILFLIGIIQILVLAHLLPDFALFQGFKVFVGGLNFWLKVILQFLIQGYLLYLGYLALRLHYDKGWGFRILYILTTVIVIALISRIYFDIMWELEDWYIEMLGASYSFLIVAIMGVMVRYLSFPRFPKGTI